MNDSKVTEQIQFNFQTTQKDHAMKESIHELQKVFNSEERKLIGNLQSLRELMKLDMNACRKSTELTETEYSQQLLS
jgi:hypothetical protein